MALPHPKESATATAKAMRSWSPTVIRWPACPHRPRYPTTPRGSPVGHGRHCDLDLRRLDSTEQRNLASYFKQHVDLNQYDRILLFLRFKTQIRQVPFLRTLPDLVIIEHDACQNYIPGSKYYGKFSRHYAALPWAKILVSGANLAARLIAEGCDAHFVSKGYDHRLLRNLHNQRSIQLGFVGNLTRDVYHERRNLLGEAERTLGLTATKTNSGTDYLHALNNIRFFLSADIGFDEYMVKNFEAMACGCLLIAYDQGTTENQALGLRDMENVVLYQDIATLKHKLDQLKSDHEMADSIAAKGQKLAEKRFKFETIGKQIVDEIGANEVAAPRHNQRSISILDYFRYFFYR